MTLVIFDFHWRNNSFFLTVISWKRFTRSKDRFERRKELRLQAVDWYHDLYHDWYRDAA